MAADELDLLFEPFVQTQSGEKASEGTGLGLPISRKCVALIGGEITAASEAGKGSIFKFNILAEPAEAGDILETGRKRRVVGIEPGQGIYRLLIVEDRETNRKLLMKILASFKFELRDATNGREALEAWREWEPHLIWMDMQMPVMNGHEATKGIKATTKGQATIIIALTASAFEDQRRTIPSEGCDDFVRRPFCEEEIFARLEKHLGLRFLYEDWDEPEAA